LWWASRLALGWRSGWASGWGDVLPAQLVQAQSRQVQRPRAQRNYDWLSFSWVPFFQKFPFFGIHSLTKEKNPERFKKSENFFTAGTADCLDGGKISPVCKAIRRKRRSFTLRASSMSLDSRRLHSRRERSSKRAISKNRNAILFAGFGGSETGPSQKY